MFTRDPKTKEELLDRMLRYDFEGDIRDTGAEKATLKRMGPNRLQLQFPRTGKIFELSIHLPRGLRDLAPDRTAEDRTWEA